MLRMPLNSSRSSTWAQHTSCNLLYWSLELDLQILPGIIIWEVDSVCLIMSDSLLSPNSSFCRGDVKDGTVFHRHQTLRQKGELVLPSISECWSYPWSWWFRLINLDWFSVEWRQSYSEQSCLLLFSFSLKPLSAGVFLLWMLLPNTTPEYFTRMSNTKILVTLKMGNLWPHPNSSWLHFYLHIPI